MIKEKNKTPIEIFIQENMDNQMYGVNQDEIVRGMVKYIREDRVPNETEMLAFAEKMSFWIDDRLCPYDRKELRSRSWLDGYEFAKRNWEYSNGVREALFEYDVPCEEDPDLEPETIEKCYKEVVNNNVDKLVYDIADRLKEVYGETLPRELDRELKYIVSQTYQATERLMSEPKKANN